MNKNLSDDNVSVTEETSEENKDDALFLRKMRTAQRADPHIQGDWEGAKPRAKNSDRDRNCDVSATCGAIAQRGRRSEAVRKKFVDDGGLMSYGLYIPDLFRRAATYVDKILKGTKPGDLQLEKPTKFELVINLKTARPIGVTIPPTLLVRADKEIK